MVGSHLSAIVLLLALVAAPALAETYKWVDSKGVVNYSNSPPPGAVTKPQVVEERISVIPPDPSLGPALAAMQARAERRAQYEEADFARRQQAMLQMQASYAGDDCPYGSNCGRYATPYYPYAGWGYFTSVARRFPPRVSPYRAGFRPGTGGAAHARGMTHAGRGSFR